jgi:hypothetical protein
VLGPITCTYSGTLTGNGYNPTNTARPVTSVTQAELSLTNAPVTKVSGSGVCATSASITAVYQVQGETIAGSGVFNQALAVTS